MTDAKLDILVSDIHKAGRRVGAPSGQVYAGLAEHVLNQSLKLSSVLVGQAR